jgi:hypothetical protein
VRDYACPVLVLWHKGKKKKYASANAHWPEILALSVNIIVIASSKEDQSQQL